MKYRIFDSHCHTQYPHYDVDRDEVIRRALDTGIGMVCIGTDLEASQQAARLAEQYEGLYASVGLHPNHEFEGVIDLSPYEELARSPKVVAIGEIGLDYYRMTDARKKSPQQELLRKQLRLASRVRKAVIIHCRDAQHDLVGVLKEWGEECVGDAGVSHGADAASSRCEVRVPVVIHSFTGSIQDAREYLDAGYCIGLNAIVTFSKAYDDMARFIPIDRLLLETDAPYLAPAPYRGKRNEPSYIEVVGNSIAAIRSESAETLFRATAQNAVELYGIKE